MQFDTGYKETNRFTFQIINLWMEPWHGLTVIPPSETWELFWAIVAFTTLFSSWNMVHQPNLFFVHCFRHRTKVVTKTRNHLKPPETTWNQLKRPETTRCEICPEMHALAKMAEMAINRQNRQTINKNSNEMAKGPFAKWRFWRKWRIWRKWQKWRLIAKIAKL